MLYAILFLKGTEGTTSEDLASFFKNKVNDIEMGLKRINDYLIENSQPFVIKTINNKVRLTLSTDISKELNSLMDKKINIRLSKSTLETLTIIGYKQPITRMNIEKIRGVSSDYAIFKLINYDLIKESGRSNSPGRPRLFATTQKFLEVFDLNSISELPAMTHNFEKKAEETRELFLFDDK